MTVADGFITEYVQDGKYFVRSQQIFIAPCRYKTVIAEVTIPNYNLKPGDFSITEIVETECQYIKVTTEMGKNKITTVYEKED